MRGRKKLPATVHKEQNAESWCFVCKDGGYLRICDYKLCLKSYHPGCVGKNDSFLESGNKWDCAWHRCFDCRRSSYLHCYMCTTAVCRHCRPAGEILRVKGIYGFCQPCLNLVLLLEEKRDCDSDGRKVDFNDLETLEGLFKNYYVFIKSKLGFELADIYAAKESVVGSCSEDFDDKEEDKSTEYDKSEEKKSKRQKTLKRLCGRKPTKKTAVSPNIKEFIGSVSRSFPSVVVENVKLVYLKRSVLNEMLKEPEVFEEKVTGCIVRVILNPYDCQSRKSHQLAQVKGAKTISTDQNNTETVLLLSIMPTTEIPVSLISDEDFSKEEFEEFREKLAAGEIEMPTVEVLQQKAESLHKDMASVRIRKELDLLRKEWKSFSKELDLLQNERGLSEYLEKIKKLQSRKEQVQLLENVPTVIQDEYEPVADSESKGLNHDGKNDEVSPESTTPCDSVPCDELLDKNESEGNIEHGVHTSHMGERQPVSERSASVEPQQGRTPDPEPKRIEVIDITSDDEGESETSPENKVWCMRSPDGKLNKFQLCVLRSWCKSSPYVPDFLVWKEDGREEDAIPLPEAVGAPSLRGE